MRRGRNRAGPDSAVHSRDLAQLPPETFVREILAERLNARAVLVGDNFRFGHEHAGDVHTLAELGRKYGFRRGSDCRYPHARPRGFLERSAPSYPRGRCCARRTAARAMLHSGGAGGSGARRRIEADRADAEPRAGEGGSSRLAASTSRERRTRKRAARWPSVTNIGRRPTFGGDSLTIETFLLEPLEGGSPARIRVEFLKRLREERKFENSRGAQGADPPRLLLGHRLTSDGSRPRSIALDSCAVYKYTVH